MLKLYYQTRVP